MTNHESTNPGLRHVARESTYIEAAARVEAARLGHPEVDVEHLLLGLLVTAGPAMQQLAAAGVTLASARAALADQQQHDLAGPDLDTAAPNAVPRRYGADASSIPLSSRAKHVVDQYLSGDDQTLLTLLVDDEGGRIRQLLERLGVDPDDWRHINPAGSRAREVAEDLPNADASETERHQDWLYCSHRQDLPVPIEKVWALLCDPDRRADWGVDCTAADRRSDDTVELTRRNGSRVLQVLTHRVPGRMLTWRQDDLTSGRPVRSLRITLEPHDNLTTAHLELGWPQPSGNRLGRRVTGWIAAQQLRVQAQSIAQAAA